MPPENFGTISAATLLAGVGALTATTGCFSSGDDIIDVSSEAGGADYGGPEGNEEVFDTGTFETDTAGTTETSTSESTTETSTSESTTESTTETTGGPAMCGWFADGGYYECGYEGTDPGGTPIECPPGLVDGDPCETTGLSGAGCCDANGDNWYCTMEGTVFLNACG